MNHKKLRRLYAEKRLQVRRRGGRKRALETRAPMALCYRSRRHSLQGAALSRGSSGHNTCRRVKETW